MRVLLTRPEAESRALARRLRSHGIDCVVAPLLRIVPVGTGEIALDGVRALLFTSANGVAAFALRSPRRNLPVFAVGGATAAAAREAGFAAVEDAAGDGAALTALVARRVPPGEGLLLHAAGADVAGDLAAALRAAGHELRREVVYLAQAVERLPEAASSALSEGTLDGVLLFSPRTATTFVRLMADAGLAVAGAGVIAYCLSDAVAAAARAATWRDVRVAAAPDAESLIRLVAADRPPPAEEPPMTEQNPAPPASTVTGPPDGASPEAAAAPRRRDAVSLPTLAAAALAAVLIAGTAPLWRGWLGIERQASDPVAAVDIAPLAARVAAIERRAPVDLSALEARLAAVERRPPPDTAPLSDAIRRLQADVARLGERPTTDPALTAEIRRLQGTIDGLTQRLAATETAMQANRLRDRIGERALVAATALRTAVDRGGPYAAELETARAAVAEDPAAREALDALAAAADKGVPDAGALARRFDAVSAAVVQAARRAESGDWIDRTVERVTAVVTVRRVDAPPAGSVDAQVAMAEKALAARDVAAALEALAPIREAVRRAAPDWLADAEARRRVDTASATLARRVAAILGQDR